VLGWVAVVVVVVVLLWLGWREGGWFVCENEHGRKTRRPIPGEEARRGGVGGVGGVVVWGGGRWLFLLNDQAGGPLSNFRTCQTVTPPAEGKL
jgi:hypothetical protein